jgi:hypothetical protein
MHSFLVQEISKAKHHILQFEAKIWMKDMF